MKTAKEIAIGLLCAALIIAAVVGCTVSVLYGISLQSSSMHAPSDVVRALGIVPTLLGIAGVIFLARRWSDLTARVSALVAGVVLMPPASVLLMVAWMMIFPHHGGDS